MTTRVYVLGDMAVRVDWLRGLPARDEVYLTETVSDLPIYGSTGSLTSSCSTTTSADLRRGRASHRRGKAVRS